MKAIVWVIAAAILALSASAHGGYDDGHPDDPLELPPGVIKLIEYRAQLAAGITFLIAFLAGVISFTSPCGFVVLPTFFAFLFKERKRALLMTALFSLGLILGFTLLGIGAALVGAFINEFKEPFAMVSGAAFIVFGIMMFLNKGFSWFQFKLDHHRIKSGFTMLAFGFLFALGWTPCVGPVLAGILILAANAGTILTGASYLAFYALGVSLPLLLVAALADKYDLARKPWIRGKTLSFRFFGTSVVTHTYNVISGIILVVVGIVMLVGRGTQLIENAVTEVIPWGMYTFYALNDELTYRAFFTSPAGQATGIVIGLLVLGITCSIVYRQWRTRHEL